MKYNGMFEIIGPVMVGPSSSHTAGAVRIGNIARQLLGTEPASVSFQLFGSFAETYQGHGTDLALIAGVLGFTTDSDEVPQADQIAIRRGLEYHFSQGSGGLFHPNTVSIHISGGGQKVRLIASSLGGGKAEVQELEGLPLRFSAENPTLVLYHHDKNGFLAKVSQLLDSHGYNIARLALERWRRDGDAITVCEVDGHLRPDIADWLRRSVPGLKDFRILEPNA
jgi:L-serine dehydratase